LLVADLDYSSCSLPHPRPPRFLYWVAVPEDDSDTAAMSMSSFDQTRCVSLGIQVGSHFCLAIVVVPPNGAKGARVGAGTVTERLPLYLSTQMEGVSCAARCFSELTCTNEDGLKGLFEENPEFWYGRAESSPPEFGTL
jgi:hypothetical protein